jgi:imidazolonepropionase-like amidohydrolase
MVNPLLRASFGVLICTLVPLASLHAALSPMETRTVNGIADARAGAVAFTGGVIVPTPSNPLDDVTLLIRDGKVAAIQPGASVPPGYREVKLAGRHVYPGLIDFYSHYGMPEPGTYSGSRFRGPEIMDTSSELATNAFESIRSHVNAAELFTNDVTQALAYRKQGFTSVLSFQRDGIARGTSIAVLTDGNIANTSILKAKVTTHLSFERGSAKQVLPASRMGAVALLRQTYLDADWYAAQTPRPFIDLSLEAWHANRELPKVITAFDWKTLLLADKLGDEFSDQYLIKSGGDEYQRVDAVAATRATLIVGVDFPKAPDVSDPLTTDSVTLAQLKHWELAPYNLGRLEEAGIPFVITGHNAGDKFLPNLRRAIKSGLSEQAALAALTTGPAALMGETERLGTLEVGKLANLLITDMPLFDTDARIVETWINGRRFVDLPPANLDSGEYELTFAGQSIKVQIDYRKNRYSAKVVVPDSADDKTKAGKLEITVKDRALLLRLIEEDSMTRFSGWQSGVDWRGEVILDDGATGQFMLTPLLVIAIGDDQSVDQSVDQSADQSADLEASEDQETFEPGEVLYPFLAHGRSISPTSAHLLFRGATVWSNEVDGILEDTDVLVENGKIQRVGQNLAAGKARVVDATGLHLTAGIIDEHSHIALDSVNEFSPNSSMVRMQDVVDSEDIGIYRNLAGGVTAAQLLHGSANPIGGQSALVKMRWGETPEGMLIEDADAFIKFALGENVKRSSNSLSTRYPQTRMGVEQFFVNAFTEALSYGEVWQAYEKLSSRAKRDAVRPRRDLRMEAMLEILNGQRFVTSHSYVQSEINMLMHVAEQFDFRINTFTHILEGYKVADKMAAHGAGGSTFSDWWAYKWEVRYAIPYNAALMHQAGVITAINSDDPEMSRRLNQEAAKSGRYGGMDEEDALKMVTLNPAKLLHLDDRMGSIKVGKDADIVLWNGHPLAVYSKALMTLVDGKVYFDRAEDLVLREQIQTERHRLIQKVLKTSTEKNGGAKPVPEKLEYHHDQLERMGALLETYHE